MSAVPTPSRIAIADAVVDLQTRCVSLADDTTVLTG